MKFERVKIRGRGGLRRNRRGCGGGEFDEEGGAFERFGHELMRAEVGAAAPRVRFAVAALHDDAWGGVDRAEAAEGLFAGEAGPRELEERGGDGRNLVVKNGAKMRATVSGRMPEPLSETSGPTSLPVGARGGGRCGRSRRGRAGRRETVILPDFLPMASEALLTRFMTICRSCGVGELGGGTSERWRLRRVFLWIETQRRVTVQRMSVVRLTAGRRGRACRRRRASGGRDRRCGGRRPRCGRGGDWRGGGGGGRRR